MATCIAGSLSFV